MITASTNTNNQRKVKQLEAAMAEILSLVLRRDFYGTAGVCVSVQDGVIQHIRRTVERIER